MPRKLPAVPQKNPIWAKLRALRERAGLTQQQLADRAGLARETIARLESGRPKRTSSGTVDAIARALGVPPAELYEVPPSIEVRSIEPHLKRFLESDWARALKVTAEDEEVRWLRSAGTSFWVGIEPTDEAFALMVQSYRAAKKRS